MDCDYCQGIRPDHVRLDCGLSYPIRLGSIWARTVRGIPVVNVHFFMNIIIYILHIIIRVICIIMYSIIM